MSPGLCLGQRVSFYFCFIFFFLSLLFFIFFLFIYLFFIIFFLFMVFFQFRISTFSMFREVTNRFLGLACEPRWSLPLLDWLVSMKTQYMGDRRPHGHDHSPEPAQSLSRGRCFSPGASQKIPGSLFRALRWWPFCTGHITPYRRFRFHHVHASWFNFMVRLLRHESHEHRAG